MAARQGWLYQLPPVRGPRHHHHYRRHHHSDVGEAFRAFLWMMAAVIWFYEVAVWASVWFYYGLFLVIRQGVRTGRQVLAGRRARPAPLPVGQPYVAPPEPEDARPW